MRLTFVDRTNYYLTELNAVLLVLNIIQNTYSIMTSHCIVLCLLYIILYLLLLCVPVKWRRDYCCWAFVCVSISLCVCLSICLRRNWKST